MTIQLEHPYEQMAEQLMYAKGAASIQAIIQQAIEVQHATLTDEQKTAGLRGMIQAGFDSGVYPGNPFDEILAELRDGTKNSGRNSREAA